MFQDNTPQAPDEDEVFADYKPVTLARRRTGWTAERQRKFLRSLAETGSISFACCDAGISSRSAYRLRARPDAAGFAKAWDHALTLATLRLTTMAFERATRGTVKEIFRDGELVGQTRTPSDKILLFLLQHLLATGAARNPLDGRAGLNAMIAEASTAFPAQLEALTDNDVEMVPIQSRDFFAPTPGDPDEDE